MKTISILALAGLLLMCGSTNVWAMGPLDMNAEVGVFGKYVWRGLIVTDDPVVQPAVAASVAGLGFGIWGNLDTSDVNEQSWKVNEWDFTLTYGVSLPLLELNLGLIHYRYPDFDDANTTEAFVAGKANVLFSPSLTIYQDIDAVKGGYWAAGVAHDMPLNPSTDLQIFAGAGLGSTGYIEGYFPVAEAKVTLPTLGGDTSLTDAHLGVRVPLHPAPFVTLSPSLTFATLMGDVKDAVDEVGGDTSAVVWGVTATVGF